MRRITIEELKTAIKQTGMKVTQRSFGNSEENSGCPLTILAFSRKQHQITLDDIVNVLEDHSVKDIRLLFGEGMDLSYLHGFIDGFDQIPPYSQSAFLTLKAFESYRQGHHDGKLALEALLPSVKNNRCAEIIKF